ncbi:MAG: hypothetical protein RQ760_15135 [Sedimentisphaerales bacterium]|nr:hypothetical protein [Sedimentisphaerales bacterium]
MKRFLLFTLVLCLFAMQANAAMYLTLDGGLGNTVSLADGDGDGIIAYNGSLGGSTVWTVNVTTGISKPMLGGANEAKIDLNSVNVTSGGAGSLTIMLTDTDFDLTSLPGGQMTSSFGGTTNGTISFNQILDPDNNEFGTGASVVSLPSGPYGPGAFSGTEVAAVPVNKLFSLTEIAMITHTGDGQITSFDIESSVVPVPAAVILGMLGLGVAGIKLRKHV